MSLWTPSGEHPVGDERPTQGAGPATGPSPAAPGDGGAGDQHTDGPVGPGGGPDIDELRRQLVEAPAEVVVANHCYGLFELAAVYLSDSAPHLDQARLAIDALGFLVDGLGDRLGDAHPSLRDALAQIRLAFVQISASQEPGGGRDGAGNGERAPSVTS